VIGTLLNTTSIGGVIPPTKNTNDSMMAWFDSTGTWVPAGDSKQLAWLYNNIEGTPSQNRTINRGLGAQVITDWAYSDSVIPL